jgi:hypothetical protein
LSGFGIPAMPATGLGVSPFIAGSSLMAPTPTNAATSAAAATPAPAGPEKIVVSNIPPHLRDKATVRVCCVVYWSSR